MSEVLIWKLYSSKSQISACFLLYSLNARPQTSLFYQCYTHTTRPGSIGRQIITMPKFIPEAKKYSGAGVPSARPIAAPACLPGLPVPTMHAYTPPPAAFAKQYLPYGFP
ncbi:hypothetical protein [Niabella drilacis]|uniref:hypothetical protein n=1 Tax=Niabella drilacis (strain DSM 25811 / CCM 8410 / CCUG 62505 / LMG 26954 / E90) TaxID=1285928 RepID=UPI00115FF9D6|nr:hypothetical protein [Niabella drilacis]